MTKPQSLAELAKIYASNQLLKSPQDTLGYRTEDVYHKEAEALAVVLPETTEQIAETVRWAIKHHIAIVPQGGNTNRNVGAIPADNRPSIILNMKRMNKIEGFSENLDSMTVQAGVTLGDVQRAAQAKNCMFALDIGARDSCMIGGNIATNAGGMQSMRYGNMRAQVLGLEVVTGRGEVLSMMSGLLKNNTGYDLMQLFIGAEGTLGFITRAILKLYPDPPQRQTLALCVQSAQDTMRILRHAQSDFADRLMRLEYIEHPAWQAMCATPHAPETPFKEAHPVILLLELSHISDPDTLIDWLSFLSDQGLIQDAVLPHSTAQTTALWEIRDRAAYIDINMQSVRCDIAFRPEKITGFLSTCEDRMKKLDPDVTPMTVGHFGDGNLHYNVYFDPTVADGAELEKLILDTVIEFGGTFSAEHGIGEAKLAAMQTYKAPHELELMRHIKEAFDPHEVCNPGKLIP